MTGSCGSRSYVTIDFQNGPVDEVGENGCQPQDVIDIVVEHLCRCNAGLPCRETSLAITKLEEGKLWLDERTRRRIAQGVEGTNQPHTDGMPRRS